MSTIFEQIVSDPETAQFLQLTDAHLGAIGFTEHGTRHGGIVAGRAAEILLALDFGEDEAELGRVAGYLHDAGNFVCRTNHGQTGAMLLLPLLKRYITDGNSLGMVLSAIGNHEEQNGAVSNPVSAAVVIADKSDVHRSRVRLYNPDSHDIHDQVNYAVTDSRLIIDATRREIRLELTIDTAIATPMDYFEIFLLRMSMCKAAAEFLGCRFHIDCNGTLLN